MLETIDGTIVGDLSFVHAGNDKHISWYDGPLITHRIQGRRSWIYWWADIDREARIQRWIVFEVDRKNVPKNDHSERNQHRILAMFPRSGTVWVVDRGVDGNTIRQTTVDKLPENYVPQSVWDEIHAR